MTKARDLANIISGGFTADDIPNLDTAKITTGTFADARMPSTVLNSNVDLTNLSATNLTSGTVPIARLGSSGTKDSTTFLRGDNTFGVPPLGGITEADQWRLTADFSSSAEITSNLERVDTYGNGYLGTGMTESSGVFTFPSTGYWLVMAQATILSNQYGNALLGIMVTTDNSTYNYSNQIRQGNAHYGYSTEPNATGSGFSIVDVTSTSNVKVKFRTGAFGAGSILRGDTNTTVTGFSFIRLGDT